MSALSKVIPTPRAAPPPEGPIGAIRACDPRVTAPVSPMAPAAAPNDTGTEGSSALEAAATTPGIIRAGSSAMRWEVSAPGVASKGEARDPLGSSSAAIIIDMPWSLRAERDRRR